jgi:hypothetical protein
MTRARGEQRSLGAANPAIYHFVPFYLYYGPCRYKLPPRNVNLLTYKSISVRLLEKYTIIKIIINYGH